MEEGEKERSMKACSGGTPRASICLAGAQKSLVFHPAAPGGMLFQAAWASMKNSFMWKRGYGGNRGKRSNKGRKDSRSEWNEGREGEKDEEKNIQGSDEIMKNRMSQMNDKVQGLIRRVENGKIREKTDRERAQGT